MISDLGAVTCQNHAGSAICSPLNAVMNISFIVQGVLIGTGAILLSQRFPPGRLAAAARTLLFIAGPSLTVVGFVPEDIGSPLHGIAAGIHLLCGNLGMILLGISLLTSKTSRWKMPHLAGWISFAMGVVGLVAIFLLGCHQFHGIGPGMMERIGGYPLPLWLTGMGIYLLASHPTIEKATV